MRTGLPLKPAALCAPCIAAHELSATMATPLPVNAPCPTGSIAILHCTPATVFAFAASNDFTFPPNTGHRATTRKLHSVTRESIPNFAVPFVFARASTAAVSCPTIVKLSGFFSGTVSKFESAAWRHPLPVRVRHKFFREPCSTLRPAPRTYPDSRSNARGCGHQHLSRRRSSLAHRQPATGHAAASSGSVVINRRIGGRLLPPQPSFKSTQSLFGKTQSAPPS